MNEMNARPQRRLSATKNAKSKNFGSGNQRQLHKKMNFARKNRRKRSSIFLFLGVFTKIWRKYDSKTPFKN